MSTAKALRVAVWTLSLAVPAAAARIEGDLPRRADLGFGTRTAARSSRVPSARHHEALRTT